MMREKLLQRLKELCIEVNKQLPYKPNQRFDYGSSHLYLTRKKADGMHHELLENINSQFDKFTNTHGSLEKLSPDHLDELTAIIQKRIAEHKLLLESILKLEPPTEEDRQKQIALYNLCMSQVNTLKIDEILNSFRQGKRLKNNNDNINQSVFETNLLAKSRRNMVAHINNFIDPRFLIIPKHEDQQVFLKKMETLARGRSCEKTKTPVGQCGEHMSLALVKILDNKILDYNDRLESIHIDDYDTEHRLIENHAFLVFNRAKDSILEDMSTWGEEAIVFDSWANLVAPAIDINLKRKNSSWTAQSFDYKDADNLKALNDNDLYLSMTGHNDLAKLEKALIEEYQLSSLETENLKTAKSFLYALLDKVKPPIFPAEIKLYLTSKGKQLINILPGFEQPTIAIDVKLLQDTLATKNVDVLAYGLAQAVVAIQNCGIGISKLNPQQQFLIDVEALKQVKNHEAALEYLRQEQVIKDSHTHEEGWLSIPPLQVSLYGAIKATFVQRIKSLMTLFAHQDHNTDNKLTEEKINIDTEWKQFSEEIYNLPSLDFYNSELARLPTIVSKIRYLKDKLITLKENEFLPYEIDRLAGSRAREYCQAIYDLDIDWDNQEQVTAIDDLINDALTLRISVLDRIYTAFMKISFDRHWPDGQRGFKALGVFKTFQEALTAFTQATTLEDAHNAATKFLEIFSKLEDHFSHGNIHNVTKRHLKNYMEKHNTYPVGDKRFTGTCLGRQIAWKGFQQTDYIRFNDFLTWSGQEQSGKIAKLLFIMGIHTPEEVISKIPHEDLKSRVEFNDQRHLPESILPKFLKKYFCDYTSDFEKFCTSYLASQQTLNTDMFNENISFAEKFNRFYDENFNLLVFMQNPMTKDHADAMHFLLKQFKEVTLNGNEEDKAVIKGFFGNANKNTRTLWELKQFELSGFDKYPYPYMQFLFEQEYDGVPIRLFTNDELLHKLDHIYSDDQLQFLSLLTNPPNGCFTLEFTEDLFRKIDKLEVNINTTYILKEYLKNYTPSPLFSDSAVRFLTLVDEHAYTAFKEDFFALFPWMQPDTKTLESMSMENLISLYRICESNLRFPSFNEQDALGKYIYNRIKAMPSSEEKISLLEKIFFMRGRYIKVPLSNSSLKQDIITLWIEAIVILIGRDDKSGDYFKNIKPVVDRVMASASPNDKEFILRQLADKIYAQENVSDYIGIQLDKQKYLGQKDKFNDKKQLANLSAASAYLGSDKETLQKTLNFLTAPLSIQSINNFGKYLDNTGKTEEFIAFFTNVDLTNKTSRTERQTRILPTVLYNFYQAFWERSVTERAVLIDHMAVPAKEVYSETNANKHYLELLDYASVQLFPEAKIPGSEDEFALSLLKSYLTCANKYTRSLFVGAILVVSNKNQQGQPLSVGKKLALICEHMGPAYIKLAQAIESHPETPQHIKADLAHVKSQANPPPRWELFRLIQTVLPEELRGNIKYIGKLLGSASYNLALEIEHKNNEKPVLILLREKAEMLARKGFNHLKATIDHCTHPKAVDIHDTVWSILDEAQILSNAEMDFHIARQQIAVANQLYANRSLAVSVANQKYNVILNPTSLYEIGYGYRVIARMPGTEFNYLPETTPQDKAIKKATALAVLTTEIGLILKGGCFDCDRHGNQLRVNYDSANKTISLGLYDFGEMATEPPTEKDLQHFAAVLQEITNTHFTLKPLPTLFDEILTRHIKALSDQKDNPHYLIRIRKALLALQDFKKCLSDKELQNLFICILKNKEAIHPIIRKAIPSNLGLGAIEKLYSFFNKSPQVEIQPLVTPQQTLRR